MVKKIKDFLADETGSTVEKIVLILVFGLGSAAIFFGILAALRVQGGTLIENIESLNN
jgi:hypothetical protein